VDAGFCLPTLSAARLASERFFLSRAALSLAVSALIAAAFRAAI
jgi:hypothetical protein